MTSTGVKLGQAQMWVYKELLVAGVEDRLKGGSLRRRHTHSISCSEERWAWEGSGRGNEEGEGHRLNMEAVTWDVGGDLMWGERRRQGSGTRTFLSLILALQAQPLEHIAEEVRHWLMKMGVLNETRLWG